MSIRRRLLATASVLAAASSLAVVTTGQAHAQTGNWATFIAQSAPGTVAPGESFTASVTFRNDGTSTWYSANERWPDYHALGSQSPTDNQIWGGGRIHIAAGTAVAPGQTYTFTFTATAPSTPGNYPFQWRMLQEQVEWFGESGQYDVIAVQHPPRVNDAQFEGVSVPTSLVAGQDAVAHFTLRNTGNTTWKNDANDMGDYRLRSENPTDNMTWGTNRGDMAIGTTVPPGSSVTIPYPMTAPSTPGTYSMQVRLIEEGVEGFGAFSSNVAVTVIAQPPELNDATYLSGSPRLSMAVGERQTLSVTLLNTGNTTWTNTGNGTLDYRLRSEDPIDNVTWGFNRVDLPLGGSVAPGQAHTFTVDAVAPATPGVYTLRLRMIRENVEAFGDSTPAWQITVTSDVVTNCPAADPTDDLSDTAAIQQCLDTMTVVQLSPAKPGYRIGAPGLLFRYPGRTLTSSQPPAKVTLLAARDLPRTTLMAVSGEPSAPGDALPVDDITIEHVIFDGRNGIDRLRPDESLWCGRDLNGDRGAQLNLQGRRLTFRHNESVRAVCGTGLGVELWPGSTVEHNYIGHNGRGVDVHLDRCPPGPTPENCPGSPWADGLTVFGCADSSISNNVFVDNTDIDLVLGASRNCRVENNTIRHESAYGIAGLMIENDFVHRQVDVLDYGVHTGSVFRGNQITSARRDSRGRLITGLSFGLLVGTHPWALLPVWDAGTVTENTVSGASMNLVVEGIHAGIVTGNVVSNPTPTTMPYGGRCWLTANFVIGHYEQLQPPAVRVDGNGPWVGWLVHPDGCVQDLPINPPDNDRPVVALTAPATDANFGSTATITMTATASDPDGTVSRVEFLANDTVVATDTTSPFSATYTPPAVGMYELRARAVDNRNGAAETPPSYVTVSGTNTRPNVTLTAPANGATVTAPVTLSATASDPGGSIARVEFFAGESLITTDTTAPYSVAWTSVPAGTHVITARAHDNGGAVRVSAAATVTVNTANPPPSVTLTAPVSGASSVAGTNVTLRATASDPNGTVARVEFYRGSTRIGTDTTAPYSVVWASPSAGSYTLTARAYDNAGLSTTSAPVSYTVRPSSTNPPPTVAVTVPAPESLFLGPATVEIHAAATDNTGVARVEFFAGRTRIGTDTTAPFSLRWTNVGIGVHGLTAVAYDTAGLSTTSAVVRAHVVSPDTLPTLLQDYFNDNALAGSWTTSTWTSASSTAVTAAERNQRLEIGPLVTNSVSLHYRGIASANTYNFTGGAAYVRLVQPPASASTARAYFAAGFNTDNYYRFRIYNGTINAARRIAGVKANVGPTVAYSPANHAFLRIRHNAATAQVVFETAPVSNGRPGTWTVLHAETWNARIPVASTRFELKAGTESTQSTAPGTVIFDDFRATPPASSGTIVLQDLFDGGSLDLAKWSNTIVTGTQDPGLPATQQNGRFTIGPLPASGHHYNGISTAQAHDLTGRYVQVQLVTAPAAATTAQAMLSAAVNGYNHYRIFVSAGRLRVERKQNNLKTTRLDTAYSTTNHAFWRIRHDPALGRVLFETATASGGLPGPWTTLWSEVPSMPVTALRMELKAGVHQNEPVAPGTVAWDNFTIASGTGVSTEELLLADDFSASSLNAAAWGIDVLSGTQDPTIPVAHSGGALAIGPLKTATGGYNGIASDDAFDLTDGYAWTRLINGPAAGTAAWAMFTLVVDGDNHYRINAGGDGLISFEKKVAGVKHSVDIPFNATSHAFWRIRHDRAANTIVFETAPNQSGSPGTWTVRRTVARELAVTALRVELKAGNSQPQTVAPGTVRFDNVKVARQ